MEGDLIQGTLQGLLQNRNELEQKQQAAQQQQLQTMRTPLPQTNPVEAMINDYLMKYGNNPTMSWSAAASAIGAQGERERKGLESQLLRQQEADAMEAKYAGEALKEADTFGAKLASAAKAGRGAGVTVKMDKDGNMVVYDPATQETRVVHASQRGEYQRVWMKAYEKAVSEDMENPEGYAANVASKVLAVSPGFNPQKTPVQSGKPQVPGIPEKTPFEPLPEIPLAVQNAQRNIPLIEQEMKRPENQSGDRALILQQELAREQAALKNEQPQTGAPAPVPTPTPAPQNAAPAPRQGLVGGAVAPQQPLITPAPAPVTATPAPGAATTMQYVDPREKEAKKSYGGEEGKELFKERKKLDELHGANSKLMGQLNLLEGIYSNPNIPQGELAGQISAFRSGMKSLGVDVGKDVGMTDLAKAVSTSLALTQRTADGQNLLPGQMSNYEDQLLQKMAPTLSLTQEGRMALVQMMKQMAASNLRISQEGTKMAAGNKDMLPANWYQRKERLMLEEQAKMKALSEALIKQYGGR